MDEIGSHYVFETYTGGGLTKVFGKLIRIQENVFGTNMTGYTFSDCIVNNEDGESFRVSQPITIYSHTIINYTKTEPMAEAMIYALSKIIPYDLHSNIVAPLTEHIQSMPLKKPTRTAINIEGDNEDSSSNSDSAASNSDSAASNSDSAASNSDSSADYGGKRRQKTNKRKNKRRRQSIKKH
jgi:hypothetical protein